MKFTLRLGVSLVLIALLFAYFVDAQQVLRILRGFHPLWLGFAIVVATADRILMAYKWTLLLKAQGYRLPLFQAVTIYCTSMVWGMVLPATVGADAIRAVMATRRGFNGTDVVTSIVIERMVGFVLALALGIVSLIILQSVGVLDAAYDFVLYCGFALLVGSIGLLCASMNETVITVVTARLPVALRESQAMHYLTRFASAYRSLGANRIVIARFGGLTVIEQLFSVVFSWTLARGLGVPADLLLLLGVLPLSMLISRLPISFDGLGIFEAVFVALLMLAGISAESSLAIAISGRVIQLLAFLPWWFAHVTLTGAVRPPQQGMSH
jgi:uncharacterized protein (TIRG00374 family)